MEVETTKEYNGYFCSVAESITILYIQPKAYSGRVTASCPHGIDGGNNAPAAGCSSWEDECRVEDQNIQQNLNMLRKAPSNLIKRY